MKNLRAVSPSESVKDLKVHPANGRFAILPGKMMIREKFIPLAMKGALAVVDQGLIAGSNFVIGILLARWLAPEQYGAYAVAFAVFLLLAMLYQALLLEPLGVFGASAYGDRVRGYIHSLLRVYLVTALAIFLSLCIAAGVAFRLEQADGLPGGLLGLAFSAPCVLLFWLIRRAFYLQASPAAAVWGALLYCALALGGLYVAYRIHRLSPLSAFLLMGLGAIGGSVFLFSYLRAHLPRGETAPSVRETWQRHWRYGKWALASAALMWVPANIFYPLVSSFNGMAQAGQLKALMNFATPMLQLYAALSLLLVPYAARVYAQKGCVGAREATQRIMLLCVSGAALYWAVLLVFQRTIFRLLYSGRYSEVEYLMPVVALASVSLSAFFGPATVLRAMEAPESVFRAVFVASVISVSVGVPATKVLGVEGGVWGVAISETIAFVAVTILLRRKLRRIPGQAQAMSALSAPDSVAE
jgi:O-antigen/teichoic acid export membrane protein